MIRNDTFSSLKDILHLQNVNYRENNFILGARKERHLIIIKVLKKLHKWVLFWNLK